MSAARRHRRLIGSIHRGPSVNVGEPLGKLLRAVSVLALAGLAAGCMARPVGDFGRAAPSWTHDTAMPYAGKMIADGRGEPVSNFNQTDQEDEMHNRVWRFLVAAHAKDWFYDTAVEWQRTRIIPARDTQFSVERYYRWLKSTSYQSSRTRYATVGRHIAADLDTVPTTFISICEVIEVDRQRAIALQGLSGLGPAEAANVAARKSENDMHIAWFVRALTYRYQSYSYALDHLLVETPHEQSLAVDDELRQMSLWVDRANRWDFCGGDGGHFRHGGGQAVIPSRYETLVIDREAGLPRK
jgi:hypothetical protein